MYVKERQPASQYINKTIVNAKINIKRTINKYNLLENSIIKIYYYRKKISIYVHFSATKISKLPSIEKRERALFTLARLLKNKNTTKTKANNNSRPTKQLIKNNTRKKTYFLCKQLLKPLSRFNRFFALIFCKIDKLIVIYRAQTESTHFNRLHIMSDTTLSVLGFCLEEICCLL